MTTLPITRRTQEKTDSLPASAGSSVQTSPPGRSPVHSLTRYRNEDIWSEGIVFWSRTHPELAEPPELFEE